MTTRQSSNFTHRFDFVNFNAERSNINKKYLVTAADFAKTNIQVVEKNYQDFEEEWEKFYAIDPEGFTSLGFFFYV